MARRGVATSDNRSLPTGSRAYHVPVLILLPPSQAQAAGKRGRRMDPDALSFPQLSPTRAQILADLMALSLRPDAHVALGLGPGVAGELARNARIPLAPALPVHRLYCGVLHRAFDYATLAPHDKRRAQRWVVVFSALYGALRLADQVAPYRLAMTPGLPSRQPLARHWREHLDRAIRPLVGERLVLDCRSAAYAAAWPVPSDLVGRVVSINVPGATHYAKHTRGLIARAVCEMRLDPRSPESLADSLAERFDLTLVRKGRPIGAVGLQVKPVPTGRR